jgi:hypothetical protein
VIQVAPGVYALGGKKGGHARAFLLDHGELTLVDTLFEDDAGGVLAALRELGRSPRDLGGSSSRTRTARIWEVLRRSSAPAGRRFSPTSGRRTSSRASDGRSP